MPTARSVTMNLLAACAAMAAGCAAPVLSVRHVLPAPVTLPEGTETVRVGDFRVHPPGHEDAAAVLTEALQHRLSRHWAIDGDAGARAQAVHMTGRITLKTDEQRGTRRVRTYDDTAGAWQTRQVPTLVRTATAHVTCRVTPPGAGGTGFALEADRSYDSTADPRVRGPLGLGRPDDPDRVPATEQVVGELLRGCAEDVVEILAPQTVEADIKTRGVWNADANEGLKAAEQGDLDTAVRYLTKAVEQHPDDAAMQFDLAAVLEASGQLEPALRHYRAAMEQGDGQDTEAALAAQRVDRVLKRRGAK